MIAQHEDMMPCRVFCTYHFTIDDLLALILPFRIRFEELFWQAKLLRSFGSDAFESQEFEVVRLEKVDDGFPQGCLNYLVRRSVAVDISLGLDR